MATQTLDFTQSLRPPLQTSQPMSATLPNTIDFDFDSLRSTMSSFTLRFDDYIKRARSQLLSDRTEHKTSLSRLSEQTHQTEAQIQKVIKGMKKHEDAVKAQDEEIESMQAEVEECSNARDRRRGEVEDLKGKERDVRRLLTDAKARSKNQKEWIDGQREQDVKELAFWEGALGVRMEGTGREDVVRFVFVLEGGRTGRRREASFELCMGNGYVIEGCEPTLGEHWVEVQRLGQEMEEQEELGALLKGMRVLFVRKLSF